MGRRSRFSQEVPERAITNDAVSDRGPIATRPDSSGAAGSRGARRLAAPLLVMWSVGMVLMHFSLFRVAGFDVTFSVLVCSVLMLFLIMAMRIRTLPLFAAGGVLMYALALGFPAKDAVEYIRSFLLLANLTLLVWIVSGVRLPKARDVQLSVSVFVWMTVGIALLVTAQSALLNLFGDYTLLNPFGRFSALGPGGVIYEPHILAEIKRPNGIFSEPSVAGWFLTFAGAVALVAPSKNARGHQTAAIVCAVAAVSTFTISGVLNVFVLVLVKSYLSYRHRRVRFRAVLSTCAALALVSWLFFAVGMYQRVVTAFDAGTSVYFRVIAPVLLLGDSLAQFPLGHPLGQVDYIASRPYMVNWERGNPTNIDNSFLFITYYFGVVGAAASVLAIGYTARLVLRRDQSALVAVAMVLALCETGAFWSHSSALMIGYTILLIRISREPEVQRRVRSQPAFGLRTKTRPWSPPFRASASTRYDLL